MSKLSIQVEKQVVMALTSIILLGSGCEDRVDSRGNISVGEGTPVDVTFRIGLADEADAYTLSESPATKVSEVSDKNQAFSYALCPSNGTKAATSLKPDNLYNLEIRQYRGSDGAYLGGNGTVTEEVATGSLITATLQPATKCHLVLVAWGKGNTTNRLGTVTLSKAQEVSVSDSYMNALDPSKQDDINKMPYVLHLTDVNVSDDGSLYSTSGEAIDIRLLLKRLAVRLKVDWTYNASVPGANYQLNQILLQSVPLNYNVVAAPDTTSNNTYPSLLEQFTTVQLTAAEISAGSYSCWLPVNVRGMNPAATSLLYRIKSNAPTGSTYIDFQAVNQNNTKQKLSYRVYLGSNDTYDFNLYGNRNYSYTMNFNHTKLPTADLRVSIIDPIPASQGNSNLVPTANCFMVAPGGSFCFNPYKYAVNGNNNNPNTLLQSWCSANKIKSVKVLWQTKENGDVGDPVLGVVSSATDHTNIVDMAEGDSFENARIYCRVAPNTTGGSGVIAAYDGEKGTGDILWSWHIWVTDYNPDPNGNTEVQSPVNKRKLKFTNHSTKQLPMMDRNLGAMAGYTLSDPPKTALDMSKASGLHYQWGRKDPFPGSYSATPIDRVDNLDKNPTKAPKGLLNRYAPNGVDYIPLSLIKARQTLRNAYKIPMTHIMLDAAKDGWCEDVNDVKYFWNDANGLKPVNDPCPVGWRIVAQSDLTALSTKNDINGEQTPNAPNIGTAINDGGLYLYYQANGSGEASYFRFSGYRRTVSQFDYIGQLTIIWMRNFEVKSGTFYNKGFLIRSSSNGAIVAYSIQDGHITRCIQERE